MRIGFDVSQTGNSKAGCGYFADSLIQALTSKDSQNEYILYPYFGTSFFEPQAKKTTRRINHPNVSQKLIGKDLDKSMAFWKDLPPNAEERLGNPDVIHANNYSCPKDLKRARIVYTLYDLNFLEYPELTTEENRCKCFDGIFCAAIYADFIISISHYSRNRFLEVFPHYPERRIRVIHLGSRFSLASNKEGQSSILKDLKSDKFWLAVGTLEPRKNWRRLLSAFALYRKQTNLKYPLVLVGGKGWLESDLHEFIETLGLSESVRMLNYVSDIELCWLYKNCYVFVFPSLYEGFGLPVLEAMGLGAAVITSNTTSLPEVADDAAHYINPSNEYDIKQAFQKLERDADYRYELKRRAVIQSKKFSWEKCAFEVLKIYNEVVIMPKFNVNFE